MICELDEFSHVSVAKDCIPTVSTEMATCTVQMKQQMVYCLMKERKPALKEGAVHVDLTQLLPV